MFRRASSSKLSACTVIHEESPSRKIPSEEATLVVSLLIKAVREKNIPEQSLPVL